MGVFGYFSFASKEQVIVHQEPTLASSLDPNKSVSPPSQTKENVAVETVVLDTKVGARRFSLEAFRGFSRKNESKLSLSSTHPQVQRDVAADASRKPQKAKSDKQAKKSALALRAFIVGSSSAAPSPAVAKPQLVKLKSQLMQPKMANKVIAELRQLPATGETPADSHLNGPIHAVCLQHKEADEDILHFSKLSSPNDDSTQMNTSSVVFAPLNVVSDLFNEMHIIDLIRSPDLGLGQPGDGNGILAGALPTAETVIEGIEKITPEIMALGYATGRAVIPDHTGIYPPTDRISVLTYWWGLEVVLPSPSLKYLSTVKSVSGTVVNFLTALALINNGVREILPFVRYISQFIDFEFNAIKAQDKGSGVVCAATWIMPAALVPRPWDFPPPPPPKSSPNQAPAMAAKPDVKGKPILRKEQASRSSATNNVPIAPPMASPVFSILATSNSPSGK